MAYKALYRTYRPQTFGDVVGQEAVVKTLQNAIMNNKISHAYLFSGPRGTGKTSIARIFAKALNCLNVHNGEPCDECNVCREISEGISPDVIEIDAASNNGVDEIRDIREKVKYLPSGAKYKIYIIDEVHMLSGGAFNALLKTLEEPPKHVVFVLATTEPQKLPSTIISRCQRFEFKSLTPVEINFNLQKVCLQEGVTITEEALNAISEAADGAMRDALSILDQAISYGNKSIAVEDINVVTGTLSLDTVISLAKAIEQKSVQSTLEIIYELISKGKEVSKIIDGLLMFYRDLILYQNVGADYFNKFVFTKEQFQEIAQNIKSAKIMYYIDVLSDVQGRVRTTTTPNIFLEIALIKMCNISVEELDVLKRINEVEEKINNINLDGVIVENSGSDNEKVTSLENRINQITGELSRLELRKHIDKISELQAKVNYITSTEKGDVDNSELQYLKDKIAEIEDKQTEMSGNTKNVDMDVIKKQVNDECAEIYANLNQRINNLEQNKVESVNDSEIVEKVNSIIANQTLIANNDNHDYDEQINKLTEDNNVIFDDLHQIKEKLLEFENKKFENTNISIDADTLNEISDKMMALEKKVYQIIAGDLASNKVTKKEVKRNNGQIMLFGNDILDLDDYEVNAKEKYNFDDLTLEKDEFTNEETNIETSETINEESFKETNIETSEIINEESSDETNIETSEIINEEISEEKAVNPIAEPVIETNNDTINMFEVEKIVPSVETIVETSKEKTGLFETASSIIERSIPDKKSNNVVSEFFDNEKGEKIINKELSSIVVKQKPNNTYELEKDLIAREKEYDPFYDTKGRVEKQDVTVDDSIENSGRDKFATYNIKYITQILHDSRTNEARNDKARIEQIWKVMSRGARPENLNIIETLQEGKVQAVGNKEFILVFATVDLCNQVMRAKFKDVALRILYELLGDRYNYVALPISEWAKKSLEYKEQYQIGTVFPVLTPLNVEGLIIMSEDEEYHNESEQTIDQTMKMFGNEIKIG